MKVIDDGRRPEDAAHVIQAIRALATRPAVIMEVCGEQTHAIAKNDIDSLLPHQVTLEHGPGCPVCATPIELIDAAAALAARPNTVLCTSGDMLRASALSRGLFDAMAAGSAVHVVDSPLEAVSIARQQPEAEIVFLAVGFEMTAGANAAAIVQADREGLLNFSIVVGQVLVPRAMKAILESPSRRVQAFLAPAHHCPAVGYDDYFQFCERYHVPIVVTGFAPLDLLEGVYLAVRQLERGEARLENQHAEATRRDGAAQELIDEVFELSDLPWQGLDSIPHSGLALRQRYRRFDALARFDITIADGAPASADCISGLVLQGLRKPYECQAFGGRCTPETPLGEPMASREGACAAYYAFARQGSGDAPSSAPSPSADNSIPARWR